MPQQHKITLPDEISRELDHLVEERGVSKDEVVARALRLYAAAFKGRQLGFAVGLADPNTCELKTEFIGL